MFYSIGRQTVIGRIKQMPVRYCNNEKRNVQKDFLEFIRTLDLISRFETLIISHFQKNSIVCKFLVGQGYDGASAMSSYLHGAYVKKDYPMVLYVHCSVHL